MADAGICHTCVRQEFRSVSIRQTVRGELLNAGSTTMGNPVSLWRYPSILPWKLQYPTVETTVSYRGNYNFQRGNQSFKAGNRKEGGIEEDTDNKIRSGQVADTRICHLSATLSATAQFTLYRIVTAVSWQVADKNHFIFLV